MKTSFKRKKIATVLLSAMVMTCNAVSYQAPISTASAARAALAEDAVPFDSVDGLDEGSYSPDKVIVLMKQAYSRKYNRLLKKIFSDPMFKGYEVLSDEEKENPEEFRLFVAVELNSKGADAIRDALDYLQSFDQIYYAGPNKYFEQSPQWAVNDPGATANGLNNLNGATHQTSKPAFDLIHLYDAWDITPGSPNVTLGNYETLYYNHEDLIGQMWENPDTSISERHGYNFFNNRISVYDDHNDHGTLTAGIMCAAGDNNLGSAGVAFGSKLMATMGRGSTTEQGAIEFKQSMQFLTDNSVKVYNISMQWGAYQQPVLNAIKGYTGLVVVAAGNSGINLDNSPCYPASYSINADNVITVGSVDNNDHLVNNYGQNTVNIAAPSSVVGTGIYRPDGQPNAAPQSNYGIGGGTSSSAPVVAGVIALMWSANPTMTREQVKEKLLSSADYVPALNGKIQGGRRLNAENALKAVSADNGNYFFRSKANGRYLDLNTSTNTLITHDFNAGNNQKYTFEKGSLKSLYNNKFITSGNAYSGGYKTAVQNAKSDIAIAKNLNGIGYRITKTFKTVRDGGEKVDVYALEVKNPSSATAEVFWNKLNTSSENQIWYVEDATPVALQPGIYQFTNTSGKLLDMDQSNGNLVQHGSNNGNNQKWQVTSAGNNQYVLKTKSTVFPGSITNVSSKPVVRNSSNVCFSLYRNIDDSTGQPDGTYRIHYVGSCWSLKVQNNSTTNCAPVVFDSYRKTSGSNTNGFRWTYTKIG